MARANRPSPGRGQPVQLRFETELTAEESVSREAWRNASFPPCLKGLCGFDCGLMRHGTYGRKTPVPLRVARFDCRECQTTISRLPDFAAARRRGSLQEIEDDMVVLAGSASRWAAARRLFPRRDELSNPIRDLCGAFAAVSACLATSSRACFEVSLRQRSSTAPNWKDNQNLPTVSPGCLLAIQTAMARPTSVSASMRPTSNAALECISIANPVIALKAAPSTTMTAP